MPSTIGNHVLDGLVSTKSHSSPFSQTKAVELSQ